MALFDRYIAVDWSANNQPKVGADSIWACMGCSGAGELRTVNHRTRRVAESWLLQQLKASVDAAERVLVGLDFPYGYPAGFAKALGLHGEPWRAVWEHFTTRIQDDAKNASNRFEVAAAINRQLGQRAPYWGRPIQQLLSDLPFRRDVNYYPQDAEALPEWRQVERRLRELQTQPQSAWKLSGAGAVGSQSLVGIPVVHRLRHNEALRAVSQVWPFELLQPDPPADSPTIIHAEIWPSIVPFAHEAGSCRDEQQVRAVVEHWRRLDQRELLGNLFASVPASDSVRREEGWVLGVPSSGALPSAAPTDPQPPTPPTAPESTDAVATASQLRAPCLCGCGGYPRGKRSRFMPGHDQRINPATGRRFNLH